MRSPLRQYFDILVLHETELWNQVERRSSGPATVNLARFEILKATASTPDCRVQDLADQLRITVGAASRLTDRIESDGLVRRSPHPTDRRSSKIELTERGRIALARTETAVEQALEELLGTMDENELAVLTAFLTRAQGMLTAAAVPSGTADDADDRRPARAQLIDERMS